MIQYKVDKMIENPNMHGIEYHDTTTRDYPTIFLITDQADGKLKIGDKVILDDNGDVYRVNTDGSKTKVHDQKRRNREIEEWARQRKKIFREGRKIR